ncbi:MAG: CmpA/NrtA family ABC transporter substrate-binding protein [Chthoniobacteraceae bacterium]
MHKKQQRPKAARSPLRVGFVPLNDCAPLAMAQELNLFEKHGIEVELCREVGWATVRDKIIYSELDAAHAPAGMVVAATAGLGSIRVDCLTGLIINLHGNAITLSESLWKRGVRDGKGLKQEIAERGGRKLVFGAVFPFSSHNFLLRAWLRENGIDPDRDVRTVIVPPPQMFPNLKAGNLDGYCVGEPWNSLAVMAQAGFTVATSSELANRHPEKVLMVRRDFAEAHEPEHMAMIAALAEACHYCDAPENRERIIELLAGPRYLNAPVQALRMSMKGTFDFGHGRVEETPDFHIFSRDDANEPTPGKAAWVMRSLQEIRLVGDSGILDSLDPARMFRADIFHQAIQSTLTTP